MTVVGDVAQTGDPAGTTSWNLMLEPYVAQRWKLTELSVNYRTPAEIMAVAGDVLAAIDPARHRRGRSARPGTGRGRGASMPPTWPPRSGPR